MSKEFHNKVACITCYHDPSDPEKACQRMTMIITDTSKPEGKRGPRILKSYEWWSRNFESVGEIEEEIDALVADFKDKNSVVVHVEKSVPLSKDTRTGQYNSSLVTHTDLLRFLRDYPEKFA